MVKTVGNASQVLCHFRWGVSVESGFLWTRKPLNMLGFGGFRYYMWWWVIAYEQVVGGSTPSQRTI